MYPHALVHMLPVALSSEGAGLDRGTVLFVGWFGPAGLPRWYLRCCARVSNRRGPLGLRYIKQPLQPQATPSDRRLAPRL